MQRQWVGQQWQRPRESLILHRSGRQLFRSLKCLRRFGKFHENTGEKCDRISSVSLRGRSARRWPQINYQESGREQMWPTPNWLHQHSLLPLLMLLFPSCFSSPTFTSFKKKKGKKKHVAHNPFLFWSWPEHECFALQTHKLVKSDGMPRGPISTPSGLCNVSRSWCSFCKRFNQDAAS